MQTLRRTGEIELFIYSKEAAKMSQFQRIASPKTTLSS
jgi:hypothetical protein